MSGFQPYKCLHVPVKAAASGNIFALLPFLIPPALILIAYKLYGPAIFVVPTVCVIAIVLVMRELRTKPKPKAKANSAPRQGMRTINVDGGTLLCLPCSRENVSVRATQILAVTSARNGTHEIPACDYHMSIANQRIAINQGRWTS